MDDVELRDVYEAKLEETGTDRKGLKSRSRPAFAPYQFWMIFALVIMYWYFILNLKIMNMWVGTVILFGALGLIYFSNKFDESFQPDVMDEPVAKTMLLEKLKEKQRTMGDIPQGDIRISAESNMPFIEGKEWKWIIPFKIYKHTGKVFSYVAKMHCRDGKIQGIGYYPEGYTGREQSDIKFIRKREDIWEDRYYSGKRKQQQGDVRR